MHHKAFDLDLPAPEIILLSGGPAPAPVVLPALALPTVTAYYYGAPNIAANTILDYSMPLTVTALPTGGFSVDLSGLFAALTNVEKPAGLTDFQSRMFDLALNNPVVHLVGVVDGVTVTGGPWG